MPKEKNNCGDKLGERILSLRFSNLF